MSWDIVYEFARYFFIYAFLGWCSEVCCAAADKALFSTYHFGQRRDKKTDEEKSA